MAISDGLICQVYPVAGETVIKNIVDDSTFSGTGTPTLVDEGAEKAWSITTGTLLEGLVPSVTPAGGVTGSGVTIAVRFKATSNGSGADFLSMFGLKPSATGVDTGARITRGGNGVFRGRIDSQLSVQGSGFVLGTIYTLVFKAEISSAAASDYGRLWQNTVGRVGVAPNFTSSAFDYGLVRVLDRAFINCQNSVALTLLDFAAWNIEKSEADCAAIADDYRGVMPAPSSGTTPIAFTGTIPTQTFTNGDAVSVNLATYFSGTQTPFTFANTGASLSGTGLSISSAGVLTGTATTGSVTGVIVTGTDADTDTASSNAFNVTVADAGSPPAGTFTVGTITTTQTTASVPYTYSASDQTGIQYRINGGTAVTASASPQSITGLTASTTYGIEFRAVNSFGDGAWSASAPFTTEAVVTTGTYTTGVLRRLVGGAVLSNTALTYFRLYNPTTGALVVNRTDLSTDANGRVTCVDAAVTAGVDYKADWLAATGETRMSKKAAT